MIVVEAEIIDLPYACQPGDKFPMKEFMDFFNSTGPIPASPVRREMTGQKSDELKKMLE